jgi:putative NADPH-quinone reductase
MANLSIILAHPRHGSFNHAIAATAKHTLETQGHEVRFHDLYQENFDPVLLAPELDREAFLHPDLGSIVRRSPRPRASLLSIPTGGASRRPS